MRFLLMCLMATTLPWGAREGKRSVPTGQIWGEDKVPAPHRVGVQPRGSTTTGLGAFRGRAQLPTCRTDLEVTGVGEDLVLAMGGHQGAVAGATLQGRRGLGMGTLGQGVTGTGGAGPGHPGVCREWCRTSSARSGQALQDHDKFCTLCREGEDYKMRYGVLQGM